MSNTENPTTSNDDVCVVCYKSVDFYSIGPCDHPVCYECSTRMRVLCKQKECPICRGYMPEVIFTRTVKPFVDLRPNPHTHDQKYGLRFCSHSIQEAYYTLLAFSCKTCGRLFRNFLLLKEHMRKDHELYYCELCVDNLKVFAFERKCYNRTELAMHRRKGDNDDKSHKGHPLCQFCDQRYMDNDDLFRHLRRDHLYCHFCDADGKHQYYSTYEELRIHFLEEHYLCEEGDCKDQPLTSVFRSKIDYKAHIALVHSRHLSRGAIKHARTLEVEFNIKPRANQNNFRYNQNIAPEMLMPDEEGAVGYDEPGGSRLPLHQLNEYDFPTLGTVDTNSGMTRTSVMFTSKLTKPKFSDDEFPSLGGTKSTHSALSRSTTVQSNKTNRGDEFPALNPPGNVVTTKSKPNTASRSKPQSMAGPNSYGKALVSVPKPAPSDVPHSSGMVKLTVKPERVHSSNVSIHFNHNTAGLAGSSSASIKVIPKRTAEAFPALGSRAVIPETSQWGAVKAKTVNEPKPSKVAKAPVLPPSSLADFPTLGSKKNGKKAICVVMPAVDRPESTTINNNDNTRSNNNFYTATNANKSNGRGKNVDIKSRQNGQKNVQQANKLLAEMKPIKNKGKKNRTPEGALLPSTIDRLGGVLPGLNCELEPVPTFVVRPPPGFEGTLTSNNDLTFTNSSGQSFSIVPASRSKSAPFVYIQPRNFHIRNTNLIRNFTAILGHPNAMREFKLFSDEYRGGTYKAENYYGYCKIVLDDAFEEIFPELLVLLPDIEKQQELFKLHNLQTPDLEQCSLCKQIVFTHELELHMNTHYLENHFQSMGIEQAGVPSKAQQ